LLNGATVLSLALCVGAAGLWIRSFSRGEVVIRLSRGESFAFAAVTGKGHLDVAMMGPIKHTWELALLKGELKLPSYSAWPVTDDGEDMISIKVLERLGVHCVHWHFAGFRWFASERSGMRQGPLLLAPIHAIGVPYWLPTVLFAALPLARTYAYWRRRRRSRLEKGK
jgi:hypothetical protein